MHPAKALKSDEILQVQLLLKKGDAKMGPSDHGPLMKEYDEAINQTLSWEGKSRYWQLGAENGPPVVAEAQHWILRGYADKP